MIDLLQRRRAMMVQASGGGLPAGYTQLEKVTVTKYIDTNISPNGTTWRCDAAGSSSNAGTKMFIATSTGGGHYLACAGGYWTFGGGADTTASSTTRQSFDVEIQSTSMSATFNGVTTSRSGTAQGPSVMFFGVSSGYRWFGDVYDIECHNVCHLVPAERDADNHKGLYDVVNGVFYDFN